MSNDQTKINQVKNVAGSNIKIKKFQFKTIKFFGIFGKRIEMRHFMVILRTL